MVLSAVLEFRRASESGSECGSEACRAGCAAFCSLGLMAMASIDPEVSTCTSAGRK